ncbi:hypothetical protein RCL1_000494 [Eukaryota sp. TZLM3-RCL]
MNIRLQPVSTDHITQLVALHEQSLPVTYPASFYTSLPTNPFAFVAINSNDEILGCLVAEIREENHVSMKGLPYPFDGTHRPSFSWKSLPLTMKKWFSWPKTLAYILTLVVSHEYRRLGVASFLLTALERCCKHHVEGVFLHSSILNDSATRFYSTSGFQKLPVLVDFYKDCNTSLSNRDAFLWLKLFNS